jgi:ADP-ribosylglycohydrolase
MTQDKIRGCLLGGAIGDALGYQIEFDCCVREKQVTRFKNDFGIISDDTQMTLFTANALLWRQTRLAHRGIAMPQHEAVRHGYLDWLDTQKDTRAHDSISWIKEITQLNRRRAPGNTCIRSLSGALLDGDKIGTIFDPINDSKGCGSVMRIAPCGVINNDYFKAGELAAQCAAITHGHPLAIIPSYMCAAMSSMLLYHDLSIEDAVDESLKLTKENWRVFVQKPRLFRTKHDNMNIFGELIENAIELSKQDLKDTKAIRQLGEGWTAEEALAIAIYSCLKYPNSFEDAIVCAVNHDGDSDSTGLLQEI